MKVVEFEGVNVRIAEDQPEYITLPAFWNKQEGSLTYCFELSDAEIEQLKESKRIFFKQLTFGQPMQPIHPSVFQRELMLVGASKKEDQ